MLIVAFVTHRFKRCTLGTNPKARNQVLYGSHTNAHPRISSPSPGTRHTMLLHALVKRLDV